MTAMDDILTRIRRATEQIGNLEGEIRIIESRDTHKLVPERNADGSQHYVRVYFDSWPDLGRIGVIFGEILHDLRSALNGLACVLVLANSGIPNTNTEFPIFSSKRKFDKDVKRKTCGMGQSAVTEIERVQPFHSTRRLMRQPHMCRRWMPKAIWLLHELNNADKHRLLLPVLVAYDGHVGVAYNSRGPEAASILHEVAEQGSVMMTITPRVPIEEVSLNTWFQFQVSVVHENQRFRLLRLADAILAETEFIVDHMRRFI